MPRAPIRTKPQPVSFLAGPFRGVRDSPQPGTPAPELAYDARNMYRAVGPQGVGLQQRPGFARMGTVSSSPQDLGTLTQSVLTWTNAAGVNLTTAVVDGTLWTYNWGTDAWTNVVTSANLATASVTLSTTARVALVPFAGKLMVSDGVNTLVTWDGTTGAGGITQIASVGPFYGPPVVYYAQLFGILLNDAGAGPKKTLVWSEVNDPTLGYDVSPYNNAWDNPGGYTEPIEAVAATNDALYVFRATRTIAITGAVSSDFATAGTRANVSETVGTISPWAVLVVSQGVLFLDETASLHLARYGAEEPVDLWQDAVRATRTTPRTALAGALAVRDAATETLLFGLPVAGATKPSQFLAYTDTDLQFVGVWSWGQTVDALGPVVDASGISRFAHANGGDLAAHGTAALGPNSDETTPGAAGVAIAASVTTPLQGYDLADEMRVDRVEVSLPACTASSIAVGYETSRGAGSLQDVTLTTSGGGFLLGTDVLGTGVLGSVTVANRQAQVGCWGRGRGVRVTVQHETADNTFAVDVIRVRGFVTPGNNRTP